MLAEKSGVVWFEARDELTDERGRVDQRKRLSPRQLKMMSTSPEMIEQFGRHLARVYREQGRCVVVRAEAYVALNGRPSKPLTGHDEPFVWRSCA